MNNRVLNINDIENNIEIFGNEFELEFSENYINRLRSIDVNKIRENNVFEQLKELMNLILNDKEAYNKISKSYEEQKGKLGRRNGYPFLQERCSDDLQALETMLNIHD